MRIWILKCNIHVLLIRTQLLQGATTLTPKVPHPCFTSWCGISTSVFFFFYFVFFFSKKDYFEFFFLKKNSPSWMTRRPVPRPLTARAWSRPANRDPTILAEASFKVRPFSRVRPFSWEEDEEGERERERESFGFNEENEIFFFKKKLTWKCQIKV